MFATQQATAAYGSSREAVRSDRSTEFELLAQITSHLSRASDSGPQGFSDLADALEQNRRLWTRLAADIANPENKLPAPLRAQLFYLAEFTFEHTRRVLQSGASPDALIDINKSIMRGLIGQEGQG